MGHARLLAVDAGTTKVVGADILADDGLHDFRTREEHVAAHIGHDDEVGEGGRIHGATGARTEDGRNLRDDTRSVDVALEDLSVTGEGAGTLLDTGTARVADADDGSANFHGLVHHLADLQRHGLTQGATEHGEVLGVDVDDAAVDGAVTGDDAVAEVLLLVETEIDGAMGHEHVSLFEAAFVEQDGDTFAGSHLALRMLGVDALLAATETGLTAFLQQFLYFLFD